MPPSLFGRFKGLLGSENAPAPEPKPLFESRPVAPPEPKGPGLPSLDDIPTAPPPVADLRPVPAEPKPVEPAPAAAEAAPATVSAPAATPWALAAQAPAPKAALSDAQAAEAPVPAVPELETREAETKAEVTPRVPETAARLPDAEVPEQAASDVRNVGDEPRAPALPAQIEAAPAAPTSSSAVSAQPIGLEPSVPAPQAPVRVAVADASPPAAIAVPASVAPPPIVAHDIVPPPAAPTTQPAGPDERAPRKPRLILVPDAPTDPAEAQRVLEQVRELLLAAKFRDAMTELETFFGRRPGYKDAHGHPILTKESLRIALAAGDIELARGFGEHLQMFAGASDPVVHVLFARHHTRVGDIDGARREWEKVAEIAPGNEEARAWLARHAREPQSSPPARPVPVPSAPPRTTRLIRVLPAEAFADRVFRYIAGRSLQAAVPNSVLAGYDLPEWRLSSPEPDDWPAAKNMPERPDIGTCAKMLTSGDSPVAEIGAAAQRMDMLRTPDLLNALLPPLPDMLPGFGAGQLVIDVSEADEAGPEGKQAGLPAAFYQNVLDATGLAPAFLGVDGSPRLAEMRHRFGAGTFVPVSDRVAVFEALRRSVHIIPAPRADSWLAAWLSRPAASVHVALMSVFSPNRTDVNLIPAADGRFRFYGVTPSALGSATPVPDDFAVLGPAQVRRLRQDAAS